MLGHDVTTPEQLRIVGRDQLVPYDSVQAIAGRVAGVSGDRDRFVVGLMDGMTIAARRVVLATGVTDELPDIDGIGSLWGRG